MTLEKLKQEVVSGGTQAAGEPAKADPAMMVVGTLAWIALFVALGFWRPWTVVFVLGLAVSIMLHELGHFWTARRSGMKATQFFLGFGSRVWSTHRNGVEYGLRAIPLGGFVKIIGMTNADDVAPEDEPFTYRQGTYARRMWVITAGSVMHLIIAFGLVVSVYAISGNLQETGHVKVVEVLSKTPAAAAGLQPRDVILAVDGTQVATSSQFSDITGGTKPGTAIDLTIMRAGATIDLHPVLEQNPNVTGKVRGFLGIQSTSVARAPMSFGKAITKGPADLFHGLGQATVAIAKIMNPVNVYGHLVGTNHDPATKPGTIVGATSVSAKVGKEDGWAGMLLFLASINLSVGVLNMFPLLPLDGGHAVIATYERIRSRKGRRYYADINKLMPVAAVCLALIAFMFLTGLYLDTIKK